MGSSVIQSAANKIVGFQRASVKPVVPDINSIISSISNNIITNVDNSIRNATNISNQNSDKKIEVLKTQIINMIEQIKTSAPIVELREKINNLQTKIVEVQNTQQPEQIKQIINSLQKEVVELQNTDPAKQLYPVFKQIQSQIDVLSDSRPIDLIQNIVNKIQNQVNQFKNNIKNIQEQTNLIQNTNKVNEVKNIIKNIENQVTTIQTQVNEFKNNIQNFQDQTNLIQNNNEVIEVKSIVEGVRNQINNIQTQVNTIQNQSTQLQEQKINPITQIQSVVSNIQNNINQTLQQTIDKFTSDYRDRVKQVDDAKPTGILGKFLDVYNTALGFVQFFGNKKNIDRLKGNLVALRESFAESFEVAKLVRQTIIKIVKQLSNLPKANAAGGAGLNIDLAIPGGPLRKSAPRGMMRKLGGRAGMLGFGLGGLALGGAAVNALQDSDMVQPLAASPEIPQNLVDRFSAIVDRFSAAVEGLIKSSSQKKREESTSASGGSAGGAPATSKPSSPGTAAMPSGPAVMPEADQELYTLATIAGLESGTAQGQADVAQAVYNRMAKGNTTATDILTRTGQFEPAFTAPYKISGGAIDPAAKNIKTFDDAVRFRMKKTGEKRETAEAAVKATIANLQNVSLQQNAASFVGARTSFRGSPENIGNRLGNSIWRGSRSDNQYLNEEVSGKGTAIVPTFVSGGNSKVDPNKTGMGGLGVDPSMLAMDAKTLTAKAIAQPPKKAAPTVNVLPMDIPTSGQGQQAAPKTSSAPISTPASSGQSIPIIPSSNPDNFLVLYSKMVYNIVDG